MYGVECCLLFRVRIRHIIVLGDRRNAQRLALSRSAFMLSSKCAAGSSARLGRQCPELLQQTERVHLFPLRVDPAAGNGVDVDTSNGDHTARRRKSVKYAAMRDASMPADRDHCRTHNGLVDLYTPVGKCLVRGGDEIRQALSVARWLPTKMVREGRSRESVEARRAAAIPDLFNVAAD
jgi:hypothetical protein